MVKNRQGDELTLGDKEVFYDYNKGRLYVTWHFTKQDGTDAYVLGAYESCHSSPDSRQKSEANLDKWMLVYGEDRKIDREEPVVEEAVVAPESPVEPEVPVVTEEPKIEG